MSTKSTIAVLNECGTVSQIYCHWDGYLSHNGRILTESYHSLELAQQLVSLGDLSVLDVKVEPTTNTHTFDSPEESICVYYGRDRGEEGVDTQIFDNLDTYMAQAPSQEFNYLFIDGEWYYSNDISKFAKFEKVTDDLKVFEA